MSFWYMEGDKSIWGSQKEKNSHSAIVDNKAGSSDMPQDNLARVVILVPVVRP